MNIFFKGTSTEEDNLKFYAGITCKEFDNSIY
jgi:hypothetical protein